MTKFMASAWLIIKLMCQRVEIDPDLILVMWCNRPAIEIYEPGLSMGQNRLVCRKKTTAGVPKSGMVVFSSIAACSDVAANRSVAMPFKLICAVRAARWTYTERPVHL